MLAEALKKVVDWFDPETGEGGRAAPAARRLICAELEDRNLLSAVPADPALLADAPPPADGADAPPPADTTQATATEAPPANSADGAAITAGSGDAVPVAQQTRHELVFLDQGVENFDDLYGLLSGQAADNPNMELVVLDSSADGIEQISAALAGRSDLDAVHFLTHGARGAVKLGNTWLTADSLSGRAGEVSLWQHSLASDGDLMFYGCDLASNDEGRTLLEGISALTGGDVAASSNATGQAVLGGDWDLEYREGDIETSVVIAAADAESWRGLLATFTVTNANDSGAGSFRQAIIDANALAGTDTITFNIGTGVQTINLASALPTITGTVIIDGTTQGGFTNQPLIVLNGSSAGGGVNGLTLSANNSTIRGLIIQQFSVAGVRISGDGNTIAGNWIGLDSTGTLDMGNGVDGIEISGNNNTIGGTTAADRNVISGNDDEGVDINPGYSGNVIIGNYIGTDRTGAAGVGNGFGASSGGVLLGGSNNRVGGAAAGEGNIIAYSNLVGVSVANGTTGNIILGNAIYGSTGLGIDLNEDGVTPNDAGDADAGVNNQQNFPVLSTAVMESSTLLTVNGSLNSAASTNYRIEFFGSTSGDATGHGEGRTYLGYVNVVTDGSGNAAFGASLAGNFTTGSIISATATKLTAGLVAVETSEFAANITATNTAPTLNAAKSPALLAVNEDAGAPSGAVGTLVSSLADFASPSGQVDNVSDADSGALLGIAITAADATNGTWYYSTNGGTNWNALGSVSDASARLLAADANTRLYFQGNSNYNGMLASAITFRAWDRTSGAAGSTADTSTNGGSSAFSSATDTASLSVTPVNDAPVMTPYFPAYNTSEGAAPFAVTVAMVLQSSATDVDAGALAGIAVYGSSGSGGTITYSIDGGANWLALGSVSATNALLLRSTDLVQLTPDANNGGTLTLNYRAWDQTAGSAGSKVDASVTGGSTAFSVNADQVTVNVSSVNDAPTLDASKSPTLAAISEDAAAPSGAVGTLVSALIDFATPSGQVDNATDVDSAAQLGIAVTAADTTNGTWWYSTDGGTNWNSLGAVANNNARLLAADANTRICFQPTANYNGTLASAVTFRAWDRTSGTAGSLADTTTNGGSSAFSTATDTASLTVTAVNDAPVVTTTGSALAYTENDAATAIDAGLSLSDVDTANMTGATVTLSANYVNGQDVLAFTNQLGITGSWNAATGVLTLSGTTSVANYQTALQAVTYQNSSDNPNATTRTVSFVVNDGATNSTAATRNITIAAANDAPVVTTTGSALAYTENASATVIDTGLTVSDADTANMTGATVTLSANYVNGQDVLAFTNQLGITGSWNAATGVLTLSGTTTVANYQTALRAVTYQNSSDNPNATTRTVSFVVNDGTTNSAAGTRNITIAAVNDAPVVTTTVSALAYTENAAATAIDTGLTINDADSANMSGATVTISANYVNGQDVLAFADQLGITGSWNATTGVLTLSGTTSVANYQTALQAVTYQNSSDNPNATTRTVSFVVNDGATNSTAATRNITIAAVNDAPVVTTTVSALAYTENAAATAIDAGLTVSDTDTANMTGATVTLSANYVNGQDVLAFTNQLGITGSWNAATGVLTLSGTTTVANYQTALRAVTYQNSSDNPNATTRTVSFVVNDGTTNSAAGTRNITIVAVNDAPVVTTTVSALAYTENAAATAIDTGLTINDADSANMSGATVTISANYVNGQDVLAFADQLGITGSWNAATGVLTLSGTTSVANYQTALQAVTYQNSSDNPNATTRTVSFVVNDGATNSTAATRNITIAAVNDAPVVTTTVSALAYTENAAATAIDAGLTVSDADTANMTGATVTLSANYVNGQDVLAFTNQLGITGSWNAATGVLTLSGTTTVANYQTALRAVTYQNSSDNPNTTTRTVSFVVNDGTTNSAAATRNVTIAAVNDAPVVTTTVSALAYTENAAATAIDTGLTINDADSANMSGATVTISANYVNGQDVLAFADQLGITGSWNATTGVLTLSGTATVANYQTAMRAVTYQNTSDNPSTSARTVSFVVNDGTTNSTAATRNITIAAMNDAPVVSTTGSALAYTENDAATAIDTGLIVSDADTANMTGATVTLSANYVNGQDVLAFTNQLGITGSWNAATGVLTLSGTTTVANYQTALRAVTYRNTSESPSTSTRTASFVVNDGTTNSAAGTRNITIAAVNDAPVVTTTVSALAYTENAAATAIDTGLTISDADSANMTGATVAISANYANGQDVLSFTNQLGITGSWDAATGVITLSGTTTVANYRTALRAVRYQNTSDNPSTGTRTVSFMVNDGTTNGAAATRNITIAAVNDAPVVTTTGGATAYTENAAATAIDAGLTVNDSDNANMTGATATISVNYANGQDVLAFTDQLGIIGSWNASTGVLTLTGTATVADYQTALRSIAYQNTSDAPSTSTRTIAFRVNDGTVNSAAANKNVTVAAVNDAPLLATSGGVVSYTENAGQAVIDAGLTVSDVDTNMTGATVTISGNYAAGKDVLAFANQLGITGSWNSTTGVLTLSGTTTVANYQTALRAVTYQNVSDDPGVGTRTVTFVVKDGVLNSNSATRDISVAATVDAPFAVHDDGGLTFDGVDDYVNVASPAGLQMTSTLTIEAWIKPAASANATIIVNKEGEYEVGILPSGEIQWAFANTSPGWAWHKTSFIALTDQWTHIAVTYNNGVVNTYANGTLVETFNGTGTIGDSHVVYNDFRIGGRSNNPVNQYFQGQIDDVRVWNVERTQNQIVSNLTQELSGNETGLAGYWKFDELGGATAVDSSVQGNHGTLGGGVAGQMPVRSGAYVTNEDAPLTVSAANGVIANDVDPDGGPLTAVLVSGPSNGNLTLNADGSFTYTPNANFNGVDSFSYKVNDGSQDSNVATATINVMAVNDAPTLGNGTLASVVEDAPNPSGQTVATIFAGQFADVDAGASFSGIAVTSNAANAATEGAWQYSTDGGGNWFDVGAVGDGPAALALDVSTLIRFVPRPDYAGSPPALTVRGLDETYAGGYSSTGGGETRVNVDTTTNGGISPVAAATGNLSTTVTGVNDAPIVTTTGSALSYTENDVAAAVDTGLTVSDADFTNMTGATIAISANYVNGEDVLAFTNQLGITGSWNAATGVLTLSGTTSVANYQTALRAVTYQNTSDNPSTNTRTVSFAVNDGTTYSAAATRDIAIAAVNDAPVITSDGGGGAAAVSVAENVSVATTVTSADLDGGTPLFSIVGGADAALFAIDGATGVLTFLAAPDYENPADAGGNNVYDVVVQSNDGVGGYDTQTLAVTVTAVNENAPVIASNGGGATANVNVAENGGAVTTVFATDSDLPAQTLTYSIVGGTDAAKFTIDSATGALSFVAAPDFENPTDAGGDNTYDVVVQASDGALTDTQAIAVTVTQVNDNAPVITSNGGGASANVNVAENATAVTTVFAADADLPAQTLAYSIVGGADAAKFTINSATGALSFVSAPDFENPTDAGGDNTYDVVVQASDGALIDTQAIAVTVTQVNDNAPVIASNGGAAAANVNVAENATAVTTVVAADADLPAQTLTYSIVGGADAAKFFINSSTGALTFVAAPDFENPSDAGGNNVYDVTVQASDGALIDTQAIAVTVTAVNDSTGITSNGGGAAANVNVAENATAVTTIVATDADLPAQTLTYSIVGGADAAKFTINGATGALSFVAAPDFENPTDAGGNNVYDVIVQASDGMQTDTQAIAVTVTQVNDNAPVITSNGGGVTANVNVAENATAVTTVVAADADLPAQILTYSIVGGADAAKFTIDSATGALSFVAAPDFESPSDAGANNVYDVTVQASDGALTDTQAIAVTVTQVNDNAPVINSNGGGAGASVNVAENATTVTTLAASDADLPAQTLNYSIVGGADAAKFLINGATGALRFVSAPDFENPSDAGANNVYDVIVQASDGMQTDTQAIAVTVTQVNDNAPLFLNGGATAKVAIVENSAAATALAANDADLPAPNLAYSIAGGADAAKFTIDAATGALSFVSAPDYENPTDAGSDNVYDVTVQASDGTFVGVKAVAVTVTDDSDTAQLPPTPAASPSAGNADAEVEAETTEMQAARAAALPAPTTAAERNSAHPKGAVSDDVPTPSPAVAKSLSAGSFTPPESAADSQHAIAAFAVSGRHLTSSFLVTPALRAAAVNWDSVWQPVETVSRQFEGQDGAINLWTFSGATTAATTASYLVWAFRSSAFITSLMSLFPAWTSFDPLPVIDAAEKRRFASLPAEEVQAADESERRLEEMLNASETQT